MRLAINSVSFVGADRDITLLPGLNIIVGPIASGKSTVLDACRGLIGAKLPTAIPELQKVLEAIVGEIDVAGEQFQILRRWVTTPTAPVDIAGTESAERVPALQPDRQNPLTYSRWMLEKLQLPIVEVPQAPTKPESDPTPVSLNDFLMYCVLDQDEIATNVFGHKDPFKNIKRKYVFELIYGLYGVELARIQEALRSVSTQIRALQADSSVLERVLRETAWENRAVLQKEISETESALAQLRDDARAIAKEGTGSDEAARVRAALVETDLQLSDVRDQVMKNAALVRRLTELSGQLTTQRNRLVRSVVAGDLLVDFEFRRCPRCGAELDTTRATSPTCGLCLQPEAATAVTRRDLVVEQDRVESQLLETNGLVASQSVALVGLRSQVDELEARRRDLSHRLDDLSAEFISSSASEIARVAAERARLDEQLRRLRDYLKFFERLDAATASLDALVSERRALQGRLESEEGRRGEARGLLAILDAKFRDILSRLRAPEIGDPALSYIDRDSYMPMVGGRSFDNLSSQGLKVLVNVAHALAHHETAIELGLKLPGILIIDGPTGNIGRDGDDLERVESIYSYLIEVSRKFGDQLQIIVADNDIPGAAEGFVRLRLTDDDRLVPTSLLGLGA